MRYFFEVSYDGTAYHGWQVQDNAITVQAVIHKSMNKLFGKVIETVGSGRTDTGVHALQQFFHWDSEKPLDEEDTVYRLNAILPRDIAIKSIYPMSDDAHARFSALSRSYEYVIARRKDPMLVNRAYTYYKPLDIYNMQEAAKLLLGKQDFEAFSKVKTEVNNFFCNVLAARWLDAQDTITFYIKANRFLRGMVRAIVGTLLLVGEQKIDIRDFKNILLSKDRSKAGRAVPASGLYLHEIIYPEEIFNKDKKRIIAKR